MQYSSPALSARNFVGLLNETFAIYGKHIWWFLGLVAVVQVPLTLTTITVTLVFGGGPVVLIAVTLLGALGSMFVYGTAVVAVGQHYLAGAVDIRACYSRVWWWVLSLAMVTVAITVVLFAAPVVVTLADKSIIAGLAALLMVPAVVVFVYWSMAIQTVVVEGRKSVSALARSYRLVKGSWWRVFGILLVVGLVALGLGILVNIPFMVSSLIAGNVASELGLALQYLGALVVELVIAPVVFIAGTLLYYDLRLRKEEYSFSVLSQELGIALPLLAPKPSMTGASGAPSGRN